MLEWKHSIRTYLSYKEVLARKLVTTIVYLYILGVCLFVGFTIGKFLDESNLFTILLNYFTLELFLRYFLKETHIPIQFRYLPTSRVVLSNFILIINSLNPFNLISFFLFTPIFTSISNIPIGWVLVTFLLVMISNFLLIIVKSLRKLRIYAFLLCSIILIVYNSGVFNISQYLSHFDIRILIVFLFCITTALYFLAQHLVRSNLFLDAFSGSQNSSSWTNFFTESDFIKNNILLVLEIKLILRNKRPLYYLLIIFFNLFFFLLYDDLVPQNFKLIYWIFLNSILIIVYGQFLFAWESEFFQYLMIYTNTKNYINAKLILLNFIGFVNLLCAFPIAIVKNELTYFLVASLFSLGVSPIVILLITLNNRIRLSLDQNALFNYQGVSIFTWIIFPALLIIPEFIILPFQLLGHQKLGLVIIGVISLIALVHKETLARLIATLFGKIKYRMYDGFKNSN